VFRELAVSYMGRFDLAHVDPTESNFDALGKGVEEGRDPGNANKYVSKGLTRSRTDNLVVMRAPSEATPSTEGGARSQASNVTTLSAGLAATAQATAGTATALKLAEPERAPSPTEKLEQQNWSKSGTAAASQPSKAERREEAKAKGYEGEMCGECGHFSLVRNGTCMKCDTCGSTTGCS
jgi:ribonucleoside-diphosphate reductase alpha chain